MLSIVNKVSRHFSKRDLITCREVPEEFLSRLYLLSQYSWQNKLTELQAQMRESTEQISTDSEIHEQVTDDNTEASYHPVTDDEGNEQEDIPYNPSPERGAYE